MKVIIMVPPFKDRDNVNKIRKDPIVINLDDEIEYVYVYVTEVLPIHTDTVIKSTIKSHNYIYVRANSMKNDNYLSARFYLDKVEVLHPQDMNDPLFQKLFESLLMFKPYIKENNLKGG